MSEPSDAIKSAEATVRAARRQQLEQDARGLQLRLGYLAVQECKIAVEKQRVLQALLEGEAEYQKLGVAEPQPAEMIFTPASAKDSEP